MGAGKIPSVVELFRYLPKSHGAFDGMEFVSAIGSVSVLFIHCNKCSTSFIVYILYILEKQ